jgi:uncharacterized protein YbjQ (UPF0145 family)
MSIPVTTTFTFEGSRIREYLGVVRGVVIRGPSIGQRLRWVPKVVTGGSIESFTEVCEQARQQAFDLVVDHATALGANAIVGLRYDASGFGGALTEVLCYGTAVVVEPAPE